MARIKLGELVAEEVLAAYLALLGAELDLIEADAGDGVTLAMPAAANAYPYEKPEVSGGELDAAAGYAAHLEVFEQNLAFSDPYTDQDSRRAVYRAVLFVRVTFFNDQATTRATVEKRRRRYSAGLFNVANKNPELGSPSSPIRRVVPLGVLYDRAEVPGGMLKTRITVELAADVEEVQP